MAMKISKNSWHYKLVNAKVLGQSFYDGYEISHSLCLYFWQVVKSILLIVFLIVLGAGVGMLVVYPAAGLVGWMVTGVYIQDATIMIGAVVIALACVPVTAIITAIIWIKIDKMLRTNIPTPSLISSYIQAKKDKLCPVIEFTK
jgi:hypothetical protein